jgi:uncharacterized protein (TIGR00369 family)
MNEEAVRRAFEAAIAPDRDAAVRTSFLGRFFGLEITHPEEGRCRVRLHLGEHLLNSQGALHGGVISFILDVAMGQLLKRSCGRPGTTLEMKTQYLRAADTGTLVAEAIFLKRGRSICFLEGRLTAAEGELLAISTATWRLVDR